MIYKVADPTDAEVKRMMDRHRAQLVELLSNYGKIDMLCLDMWLGRWLSVNGEAIYATRPREGALWSEGETVRYTRSKDRRIVYAILTEWPGTQITLKTVRPKLGTKVTLLGLKTELQWNFDSARGTVIALPENWQQADNRSCEHAWSLKIEASEG